MSDFIYFCNLLLINLKKKFFYFELSFYFDFIQPHMSGFKKRTKFFSNDSSIANIYIIQ